MKTVILAGGKGSRLSEETGVRPKPMVEIGGIPIITHIMRSYARYGFKDFVVALGYLGEVIKDYFVSYHLRCRDATVRLGTGEVEWGDGEVEDWVVRMLDTGPDTLTGGRLRRLEPLLRAGGTFMLTYGDGVADVDLRAVVDFHRANGRLATVTAVRPPARFGAMVLDGNRVVEFKEKYQTEGGWINGGFMVFEPGIFEYLEGDSTVLEGAPLERLAREGQLAAYTHPGFWHCMDTVRDRQVLEDLWGSGKAPWGGSGAADV